MKKILLVDGDKELLMSLRHILQKHGFEVFTYAIGRNVISVINSFEPDLILLDARLPLKSGIDICKEIKSYFALPVIVCSTEPLDEHSLKQCGADAFIKKPFEIKTLVNTINVKVNNYQEVSLHNRQSEAS